MIDFFPFMIYYKKVPGFISSVVPFYYSVIVHTPTTHTGGVRLHLSVLLPCEWWGRDDILNYSNIEAVLIRQQPGDTPRNTSKQSKPSRVFVK